MRRRNLEAMKEIALESGHSGGERRDREHDADGHAQFWLKRASCPTAAGPGRPRHETPEVQRLRMSAQKLRFGNVLIASERMGHLYTVVRPRNRRA